MLINSELPLCMLDQNNDLNEYDFVLFHLYMSNKKYREFCWGQRLNHPNRLMILDNSAYEFYIKGESLDVEAFVRVINELQPDYYILPDVLMDFQQTYNNTKSFLETYNITCSKPIAVIQGKTTNEMHACLILYKDLNIDAIAIPFHNSFFKQYTQWSWTYTELLNKYRALDMTEDMWYAAGRVKWVNDHYVELIGFSHVHMLGSHCPAEKIYYNDKKAIKTMDTGYPVKCAIEGFELYNEPYKPNIIIDDFLDKDLDCKDLIAKNVNKFKNT